MSITSKGRRWEVLHSLWIGWTLLTFGLLNWVAFLYIGLRMKQRKWIFWGLLYSVPFVMSVIFAGSSSGAGIEPAWLGGLNVFLALILWSVSIFHAFKVRREYLMRLEALQLREKLKESERESALRRQIYANADGGEATSRQTVDAPEKQFPAKTAVEMSPREPTLRRDADSIKKMNPSGSDYSVEGTVVPRPNREREQPIKTPARKAPPSTPTPSQAESDDTLKQQVRLKAAEARSLTLPKIESGDELEYQISSSYPFPLAFGFRSLSSIVDVRDLYREQLRIAENVLAFLGSVALALLQEQDRKEAGIDPKEYWQSGISPGDWREIIARCSKAFAGHEDSTLASAVQGLNVRLEKKGFGADVIALIRAKNDYKHDRGPTVLEDLVNATGEVQERLKRSMEALAFFTEYPIRQVEDFNVNRRGDDVVLKCLRYTGDHPSFAQEEVLFHKGLPRGDIYLDLGHQRWVPLFPFMVTMNCSHCKAKETYFIDMWDKRRGIAKMKSFERGHTMTSKEVSDALAEWESNV